MLMKLNNKIKISNNNNNNQIFKLFITRAQIFMK